MSLRLAMILVLTVLSTAAIAGDSFIIIVENGSIDRQDVLNGFPGWSWGKTTGRIYLHGGTDQIAWLKFHNIAHRLVPFNDEPSFLYICNIDSDDYSASDDEIYDVGPGYVLSKTPIGGSYRRLSLRALPFVVPDHLITDVLIYHPTIDSLINEVSQDTLLDRLSKLSGESPIEIDGQIDTIHTRYSGTEDNELAAQFIKETLESYGYETEYHGFYGGALRHVSVHDENLAWVADENAKALRTTDGGTTWTDMAVNTNSSLWGVSNVGPDSVWLTGNDGVILFSADGGDNFVAQTSGTYFWLFGSSFINPTEGWIASDNGIILHTTDAGQSWMDQNTPVSRRLYDICFIDSDNGWAVGRNGTIIHTSDGGESWDGQPSNVSQRLYGVHFIDVNNGWAVGWADSVLHTTNGGSSWQSVYLGDDYEKYHVDFSDPQHGCIVGWNGVIYVTTDGGDNWAQVGSGTTNNLYGVEFTDNQTGYAVGSSVLLKTTDGGQTWFNQTSGIEGVWRNVIATKTGTIEPDEQVIICAHYDCTSEQPDVLAPGADDNGSGTLAVIEAARLFVGVQFEKTIKFCLWTGEEQGLLGSEAYAADAYAGGDNIVGVFNLDMIAWDGNDDNHGELHCGTMSPSQELGYIFESVIDDYEIDMSTLLITWGSTDRSDHASFWDFNYPAMLGIEDMTNDFHPFYHSTQDNMSNIAAGFFTKYVRSAVGAVATLAIPDTAIVLVESTDQLAHDFALGANYPNPFNATTVINYALPKTAHVTIEVFDLLGRKVETLLNAKQQAGYHQVTWNANEKTSGMYFYRIQARDFTDTKKMVLLK